MRLHLTVLQLTNLWPSEFGKVLVEGGKPENPEKNTQSKEENQQQTQPTYSV